MGHLVSKDCTNQSIILEVCLQEGVEVAGIADVLQADGHSTLAHPLFGIKWFQGDLLILGLVHRQFDGLAQLRVLVIRGGWFLRVL